MDTQMLKDFVTAIGEDKIVGILFDNSSRKLFKKGGFSLVEILNESLNMIVINETDVKGNVYHVYKPVETIQAILTVDDPEVMDRLDWRYISC